ncbi:5-aminolevulinate synthase, erythroid-specific, mitochondrial isoform X1 [Hydra vulgaris]|uniref:5-aminolevulinate synthase n=1 Tax=Hydra vulgaris TaxID=6087 RepID=T2MH33_HYDVU|nr:5-aminolevulinate synthase, erythroid-specific, mitochondrial [Hydra vulgaris]
MALQRKCIFLKKPLETLLMAQSQRNLFVESTLQCPVMSQLLLDKKNEKGGHCPFNSDVLMDTMKKLVKRSIYTASDSTIKGNQKSQMNEEVEATSRKPSAFEFDGFFENMIQKKLDDHSYRVFRKVNRDANKFPLGEDFSFSDEPKPVTVWCSNDYLGMSRHKVVVEAAKNVIESNGVGAGGTRNISGTSTYHSMLENSLAKWHKKEAGLLFTSCYVANDTALFTLGQQLPGCIFFSDAGNHASMIHGIRTSGAKKVIYRHNDPEHLEQLLKTSDPSAPKIVVFETVHSMSGSVCPLEELCDIAHEYNALTFVDEVHAVGLYGKHGAGIGERDNCMHKMDIISGTLGKAIGCIGGYLVGNSKVIDTLRSYGSGFIFTTALPPDKVYAAYKSIEVLKTKEGQALRQKHQANVRQLKTKLIQRGFPVHPSPSHIIPVMAADPDKCTKISQLLQSHHGIYVQSINYPTVPRGQEKLRIAPTPFHTEQMMDELVDALTEVWLEVGLPIQYPLCNVECECQDMCKQGTLAYTHVAAA